MQADSIFSNLGITTKSEYDESKLIVEKGDDDLDRNAFLTLLTTQLQNQNPLDPMENEAFVAQLAQFSQLEATTQMSTSLTEMNNAQKADRIMQGASLIGKSVLADTGLISFDGESVSQMELSLEGGADQLNFSIFDQSGQQIRNFVIGPQTSGVKKFSWDGLMNNGEPAPAGSYRIQAEVIRGQDQSVVIPSTYAPVRSVGWDAATSELNIKFDENISIPLSGLSRISE
jgi:flagellar basal-body rod modification protein FlgD